MTDETSDTAAPEGESLPQVATSNVGYADVPDGWVFIPAVTGDRSVLQKLFAATDNPDDVVTRAGYGYVVPEDVAQKAGLEAEDVVTVVDTSTPDSSSASGPLDTQDTPVADNVAGTADGPLPANPGLGNPEGPVLNADDTGATSDESEGVSPATAVPDAPTETNPDAPAGDVTTKGSTADAAS